MPISQCEVGETGSSRPIRSYEIGKAVVVRSESLDGAMSQPDSHETFWRVHIVHVGREIIERPAMIQRCWQEDEALIPKDPRLRRDMNTYVLG